MFATVHGLLASVFATVHGLLASVFATVHGLLAAMRASSHCLLAAVVATTHGFWSVAFATAVTTFFGGSGGCGWWLGTAVLEVVQREASDVGNDCLGAVGRAGHGLDLAGGQFLQRGAIPGIREGVFGHAEEEARRLVVGADQHADGLAVLECHGEFNRSVEAACLFAFAGVFDQQASKFRALGVLHGIAARLGLDELCVVREESLEAFAVLRQLGGFLRPANHGGGERQADCQKEFFHFINSLVMNWL